MITTRSVGRLNYGCKRGKFGFGKFVDVDFHFSLGFFADYALMLFRDKAIKNLSS
jgi:hypothetical protein